MSKLSKRQSQEFKEAAIKLAERIGVPKVGQEQILKLYREYDLMPTAVSRDPSSETNRITHRKASTGRFHCADPTNCIQLTHQFSIVRSRVV